jgi:hypothetical protein
MSDSTTTAKTSASDSSKSVSSESKSTVDSSSSSSESSTKKSSGGGSRPISYFSSVSTDEYRSGWEAIFGKNGKSAGRKTNVVKKTKSSPAITLPVALQLDDEDLTPQLRSLLQDTLKKKARKEKLSLGRALSKSGVRLSLDCKISD